MDDYDKVQRTTILKLIDENNEANEDYESSRSQMLMIRNRPDIDDEVLYHAEEKHEILHKRYLGTKKRLAMKKFQLNRLDKLDEI